MILKYTPDEARVLKNSGQLPDTTKLNEGDEEEIGGVEFSELPFLKFQPIFTL